MVNYFDKSLKPLATSRGKKTHSDPLTRLMDERKVCSFEEFDGEILVRARDESNFEVNEIIAFEQEWADSWSPELSYHDANSRLLPHIFGQ
ncbi:Uncharacterized protein FKW44_019955 [Caligus rogercresseyi]|uniref:Uncharacterized protein n=1 Tax=Caligus rogercresseyi TaxID=217165 RepID=A0A7T8JZ55_CALRO|nr:Uncharacterized protein FKW44_019955 [Caligus rogercresseyi]